MRYTTAQKLAHIGRVIIAWTLAYTFFGFLRMYGIQDLPEAEFAQVWTPRDLIVQLVVASLATGILYGSLDLLLDRPRIQRWAYWKILTLKTSLNLVIVVVVLILLIMSGVQLGVIDPDSMLDTRQPRVAISKSAFIFIVYFLFVDTLLSMYQQVKQKFGRGIFQEMLLGKYHKPKEADRIFMFIDLKSSVTIAERLGHVHYSYLLQDCYFDLNTQLNRFKARIYQYVGDEVVLYWDLHDGLMDNNCVMMYFGFMDRLEQRRKYYERRYGLMPFFKAGAHLGRVTVAEVGLLKRDIAFHGDTVNTTSRIHDQCNVYNEQLLVSKDLLVRLEPGAVLQFNLIGSEVLKGKHSSLEIYAVDRVQQAAAVPVAQHS
ncbi:MAG: adenylate/guanylate cyclase domain-containing protein [Saprospiraceae bacterium]|nr:adenylate/guanylate cyclase domain-containing protein [Saprospiraceae bacterium]